MKIRHILATKGGNVITIDGKQTIRQALQVLVKHNVGALLIVNDSNRPVGILNGILSGWRPKIPIASICSWKK